MAICLVTLSEPELKCEPTTLQPMSLPGTGLLPSNNLSPGSLPSPATISNTCFHCSQSWLVKTVGMPTAFLVFRTLKLSSWDEYINSGRIKRTSPALLHSRCGSLSLTSSCPLVWGVESSVKSMFLALQGMWIFAVSLSSPRCLCKFPPLLCSSRQGSELTTWPFSNSQSTWKCREGKNRERWPLHTGPVW